MALNAERREKLLPLTPPDKYPFGASKRLTENIATSPQVRVAGGYKDGFGLNIYATCVDYTTEPEIMNTVLKSIVEGVDGVMVTKSRFVLPFEEYPIHEDADGFTNAFMDSPSGGLVLPYAVVLETVELKTEEETTRKATVDGADDFYRIFQEPISASTVVKLYPSQELASIALDYGVLTESAPKTDDGFPEGDCYSVILERLQDVVNLDILHRLGDGSLQAELERVRKAVTSFQAK